MKIWDKLEKSTGGCRNRWFQRGEIRPMELQYEVGLYTLQQNGWGRAVEENPTKNKDTSRRRWCSEDWRDGCAAVGVYNIGFNAFAYIHLLSQWRIHPCLLTRYDLGLLWWAVSCPSTYFHQQFLMTLLFRRFACFTLSKSKVKQANLLNLPCGICEYI